VAQVICILSLISRLGAVDEDFSKGLLELHAFMHTSGVPCTSSLQSYLRTVDMVCVPVHQALEASIGVNFLNGKSTSLAKYLLRLLKVIQVKWLCMTVKCLAPRQNLEVMDLFR
jgi:hypothetical protein